MSLVSEAKRALMENCTDIVFDEPMSRHTSFKIGGPAAALVCPAENEIAKINDICRRFDTNVFIMGNGTNLLVSDAGFDGVVIKLQKNMNSFRIEGSRIFAGSGALLSSLASAAQKASLSGLERIGGIPGTLGGAIYMNAGAYGSEIKDVLVSSSFLYGVSPLSGIGHITGSAHRFGYRKSAYTGSGKIIVSAVLRLEPGNADEIRSAMNEYAHRRADKQPLEYPSCGSVFKRPEGHFAGALIEQAGLKGYKIGGAMVSEKHAGFIINTGGASADDVMCLIEHIKNEVYKTSGIELECEVKTLGF